MLDAKGFDIFRHLVHVFRAAVSAKLLDLVSALSFCPCLVFFECCKDCRGMLVGQDVDSAMASAVVREGEYIAATPKRYDMTFAEI